ncbi:hypothetical protein Ait01nite_046300 [Actinoplanes italicus]|nr:hypothetical protein Ait01nite_046300 [Actinoplanes italicus]
MTGGPAAREAHDPSSPGRRHLKSDVVRTWPAPDRTGNVPDYDATQAGRPGLSATAGAEGDPSPFSRTRYAAAATSLPHPNVATHEPRLTTQDAPTPAW